MAVLDKCGFGESDQEGVVKSIQDFALDVYNNLCGEEKQIDAETVELFVCDYIMQFLVSLQKRAEGVPFAQAASAAGDDFVRRCQVAGYGMLSILKNGAVAVGKADVVSPLFRLVNSVDVEGWAEFTYQSLVRARTVYLGYYIDLEKMSRAKLAMPDMRRGRLRKLIGMKGLVTAIEAHSGITGLIAEKTTVLQDGKTYQFDAMWISSLCDSTAKGKPDIELVDMTSRFRTIDDIMEVTTKPIIFDGDTGGLAEHFVYTVRSLERMGVSMVIIEDKTGLKKNSLFGTEVKQTQDSIENFCAKIMAGKKAQKTPDFMICARIESLILERGMDDALTRAFAYVGAGADAVMIHSRKKDPSEIFEFVARFREKDSITPVVVVPTSFNTVTEDEFKARGVNVVSYANQLTRTGFPAMQNAARTILEHHRAKECDDMCMPIKDIITLIPEE